jgi:hypothetical protein
MIEQLLTGRRVAIADAVAIENNPLIWWRPEPSLPESEQFAIVFEE